MLPQYLVRVGLVGQVGRFTATGGSGYPRGKRVICRTQRGLELGEVLAPVTAGETFDSDGALLRHVSIEDELLLSRLEKKKEEAYSACADLLVERGISAILMDVEHLFDGRSLYFYFLGEVTPELEAVTSDLATTYDAAVQFQKFAAALTEGCGPGCGTEEATGGGCGTAKANGGGCSTCSVSTACGTSKKHAHE